MTEVTLRQISMDMRQACVRLSVTSEQQRWIASNARSLDQADADPALVPLAIYDASARGWVKPEAPMIGFAMIELAASVGFIMRLMIGESWQARGYGRAALKELIRRLRLYPEVEMIASSHRRDNAVMASLLAKEGFGPWATGFIADDPDEVFVRLPQSPY